MRCVLGDYSQHRLAIIIILALASHSVFCRVDPNFKLVHEGRMLKKYSLKEACEKHFNESFILTSVENNSQLNCMGKVFNPRSLCSGEKMLNSLFTRALISENKNSVICEYATSAKVNLNCGHLLIKKECAISAISACQKIKSHYARDLELIHAAKLNNNNSKLLDCHFSNQKL